ncbi:HD domain-containing protein [Dyella solisilvae]|uniref:HD domain-containing protein n=1 Tax=Dyella solisilvae TaxID=1920168 RepID=A0A370KA96_9GAMM|nr:HD domain-containing protein [Dyella solisilvae]RDI99357.1 HD domain-containing protein [Dyella solisilvae]
MSYLKLVLCFSALAVMTLSAPVGAAPGATASDWRQRVDEFAAEHFKHPAWGYSHSVRDYRLAHELAESDHVQLDDDVLFAAAYLHDMGMFPPWRDPKRDHADVAADTVASVLKDTGFPMEKIAKVQGAIRTHMYDRTPQGAEALYLHDADALDWLGAIGAARILALIDANGGKPQGPEVIPMLTSNLAEVPGHVLSPAGRARVPARKAELEQFLHVLRNETDNLRDF